MKAKPVPILRAAYHIVEQMTDYSSLVSLGMTCTLFRDLVFERRQLLYQFFDNLELDQRDNPKDKFNLHKHLKACLPDKRCRCNAYYSTPNDAFLEDFTLEWMMPLPQPQDFDIVKFGNKNLQSGGWLPCYSCAKIMRVDRFYRSHSRNCFGLLGCKSNHRACVDCYRFKVEDALAAVEGTACYIFSMPGHRRAHSQ